MLGNFGEKRNLYFIFSLSKKRSRATAYFKLSEMNISDRQKVIHLACN